LWAVSGSFRRISNTLRYAPDASLDAAEVSARRAETAAPAPCSGL